MPNYYQLAHDFASQTNQALFITGKAGTGKTTFLRKLKNESLKQTAIVAPTGIAAINAGGTTIHSFFQLPFTPFIPTPAGRKELISKMKMRSNQQKVLRELELLVIDEISMVRVDILDAIDTVLRHYRRRDNLPFGGVQVIFIGDMFQLSPVARREELEILHNFYEGIHFFNSYVMQQVPLIYIELDKVFRQKDIEFIQLLEEVRHNKLTPASLAKLHKAYNPSFIPPEDDTYITLTTHNRNADEINSVALKKIDAKSHWFSAVIKGNFPEGAYPVETELELKKGAKVMFVKNDTEFPRRFYNGKIGEVTFIDDDYVMVTCPGDKDAIYVEPMIWENMTYKVNKETSEVEEKLTGSFTQLPLRHAWAITIHKSQGLTFDKAIIDAGAAFAPGQVYVALSRCRSLDGMVLKSKINEHSLQNESSILQFSSQKSEADKLTEKLKQSQKEYQKQLLLDMFDFNPIYKTLTTLRDTTIKAKSSFNDETHPYLEELTSLIGELKNVGDKFSIQLNHILNIEPVDEALLAERLTASSQYFASKFDDLLEKIAESPAYSDNKELAKSYDEDLLSAYTQIAQKQSFISHLENKFTIDDYFSWRKELTINLPKLQTHGGGTTTPKASIHPDLMLRLTEIRNELAKENNVPPYVVAKTKSLQELADYLPQTPKDFLLIYGFGKVRLEKYGSFFLDEIRTYCQEKGLSSRMDEKTTSQKAKTQEAQDQKEKPKRVKGESQQESLELYLSGKTIEEIATLRDLKENTIASHLSQFLKTGEVNVSDFITDSRREEALEMMKNNPDQSAYKTLHTFLSQVELQFFTSWLRLQEK